MIIYLILYMKVADVIKVIEDFAPLSVQEKWDNSGLCIGSADNEVSSVLLGLDCSPELVDEAVTCGADMIVTHHPLIFSGLKKISPDDPVGLAVMKAVRAGISVYAAHTSADKVTGGVSWAMAWKLGLENIEVLDSEGDGVGLGVTGYLPQPLDPETMISVVKDRFALKGLRCSRPLDRKIEKVALCGGAGGFLVDKTISSGAQRYISGDISYHHFFTPEGFMLMDIGHYESELDIVQILFSLIRKNFPTFAVRITENLYSNPVYYF